MTSRHEPSATTPAPGAARADEVRRVVVFCLVALTLAGTTSAVVAATGGLVAGHRLGAGAPVSVATVLLPTAYMFSPALAHVVTRALTREGWSGTGLRPHLRAGRWRWWVLAWFAPAVLTAAGAGVFFLLRPGTVDLSAAALQARVAAASGRGVTVPGPDAGPGVLLAVQVLVAVTLAPLLNALVALGEELGWRGYLQPKLLLLTGPRRAVVLTGVVWGVWHWPLILMGYEYGTGYRGAPWSGLLLFCWFTVVVGTVLGALAVHAGSVWPAAIAHGAVNASAGLPLLAVAGTPSPLLGPAPVGVLGSAAWAAAAVVVLWRWRPPGSFDRSPRRVAEEVAEGVAEPGP